MSYVIRGFKGPEVQNFDQLYLKKDKYFEKQYRIKEWRFKKYSIIKVSLSGPSKEIRGRPLKRPIPDSSKTATNF